MNKLQQLREMTVVVADTGELSAIEEYKPQDATTNPSLLLKVAEDNKYAAFIDQARATADGDLIDAVDNFAVAMFIDDVCRRGVHPAKQRFSRVPRCLTRLCEARETQATALAYAFSRSRN